MQTTTYHGNGKRETAMLSGSTATSRTPYVSAAPAWTGLTTCHGSCWVYVLLPARTPPSPALRLFSVPLCVCLDNCPWNLNLILMIFCKK